ncbi:hypothetical protein BGZ83_000349 [Gryganskiella cystojenkinii]|nr:hypothetical protein BGZ83_000349 [Gryganskiella cystojenkinii]
MFLNISLTVLNTILTVINIMLGFGLGRLLVLYSKFGGKYANSIRWQQQGGYFNMLSAASRRRKVPWNVRAVMSMVFVATGLVAVSTVILTHFIVGVQHLGPSTIFKSISNQTIMMNQGANLPTWERILYFGDNVTDSILSMVKTATKVPEMRSDADYQVHLSEYKSRCDVVSFAYDGLSPITPPGSCMSLTVLLFSPAGIGRWPSIWHIRDDGTMNITMWGPTTVPVYEISSIARLTFGNKSSTIMDQSNTLMVMAYNTTSSPPSTVATKSWTPDGDMMITSMTTTRVYADIESLSDVLKYQFGGNELFSNILLSIQLSDFAPNATYGINFMEMRVVNRSGADIASCMTGTSRDMTTITVYCTYVNLKVIVASTSEAEDTNNFSPASDLGTIEDRQLTILSTLTTLKHFPNLALNSRLDTRGVTDNVAELFASLGFSMSMNWNSDNTMNVYFDQRTIFHGFEVPNWLVYTMGSFLVVLLALAFWTYTIEDEYTSSFFDLVHGALVLKLGKKIRPRLAPSSFKGGIQLENGRLIFEEDLVGGSEEEARYESTTNFGHRLMVPEWPKSDPPPLAQRPVRPPFTSNYNPG